MASIFLSWLPCVPQKSGVKQRWSTVNDTQNVLIQQYYEWSGSDPFCYWVRSSMGTHARYELIYGGRCNNVLHHTLGTQSIEPLYFNAVPPHSSVPELWTEPGQLFPNRTYDTFPPYVHRLHIFQDVLLTPSGDFISGDRKYVPYTCGANMETSAPGVFNRTAIYREVFVIAQFYAGTRYHETLEDLPRITPFLDFLREHKEIKIHSQITTSWTAKLLKIFGIDSTRLIGGLVRAKIAYMPRATACGHNLVTETQLMAGLLQKYINNKYPSDERRSIVLVKRSGERRLLQHRYLAFTLKEIAKKEGLRFEHFIDTEPPTMEGIFRMFNRAVIVVAPHGGGLTNLLLSKPGTVVVEAVCNRPHVNLCYQHAAHTLGLRYHAVPSMGGCTQINSAPAPEIARIVKFYIPLALEMSSTPGGTASGRNPPNDGWSEQAVTGGYRVQSNADDSPSTSIVSQS